MATQIYNIKTMELIDGTTIELKPLKIKYLRRVMDKFHERLNDSNMSQEESLNIFVTCAFEAMQQYLPEKIKTKEDLEDNLDMEMLYDVLEFGAGIRLRKTESGDPIMNQPTESGSETTWEDLDLAELETQVFIVGKWKDFDELETNLSMPELLAILSTKRELEYNEKKFLAALQGVDLDKNNGTSAQNKWEEMKARVFSKGATSDPNDVLSLQGHKAQQLGFGIGLGLDYQDSRDPSLMIDNKDK